MYFSALLSGVLAIIPDAEIHATDLFTKSCDVSVKVSVRFRVARLRMHIAAKFVGADPIAFKIPSVSSVELHHELVRAIEFFRNFRTLLHKESATDCVHWQKLQPGLPPRAVKLTPRRAALFGYPFQVASLSAITVSKGWLHAVYEHFCRQVPVPQNDLEAEDVVPSRGRAQPRSKTILGRRSL